jgi:teichuronic acid biosynthesis glycosyltransferase TuaG
MLTLVTCWFEEQINAENLLDIQSQNNFNLVIFTNKSYDDLEEFQSNPKIKIIMKDSVNPRKIHMIYETIKNNYFDTDWYSWCDIDYFKNPCKEWPNNDFIKTLNKNKIYHLSYPYRFSNNFFLIPKNKIDIFIKTIKDEQMITSLRIKDDENFKSINFTETSEQDSLFIFHRFPDPNKCKRPFITILMPIFNGIEFIDESVNSIKSQTFTDWELLIGINGHEKNSITYQLANKYSNDETFRIKVLDLYNFSNKSSTLNHMVTNYCNSDWICLLDVDDLWLNTKLEEQLHYIHDYDVIGTHCRYFGDQSNIPFIPVGNLDNFNFTILNPIINSSVLLKKEYCFWDQHSKFGEEDYELWIRLKLQNKKFYNVNKHLVLHRIHNKSFFNYKNRNKP